MKADREEKGSAVFLWVPAGTDSQVINKEDGKKK